MASLTISFSAILRWRLTVSACRQVVVKACLELSCSPSHCVDSWCVRWPFPSAVLLTGHKRRCLFMIICFFFTSVQHLSSHRSDQSSAPKSFQSITGTVPHILPFTFNSALNISGQLPFHRTIVARPHKVARARLSQVSWIKSGRRWW